MSLQEMDTAVKPVIYFNALDVREKFCHGRWSCLLILPLRPETDGIAIQQSSPHKLAQAISHSVINKSPPLTDVHYRWEVPKDVIFWFSKFQPWGKSNTWHDGRTGQKNFHVHPG